MEHSGAKLKSLISSLLFFFSIFVIIDVSVDIVGNVSGETFYVNTTGDGGAYTSIQDAINASSDGDAIFVYSGTYYENVVVNKTINLIGEDRDNTIIDGEGNGDVIKIVADWNNVSGFSIRGSRSGSKNGGIKLDNVQHCSLINNNASFLGSSGICLHSSSNNSINCNQICSNHLYGIYSFLSNENKIIGNTLLDNGVDIYLSSSIGNTLHANTMKNGGIFIEGDLLEHWNTHEINDTNTINGKTVYYWKNRTGGTIPMDCGQAILANCTKVMIKGQELINCSVGIELGFSSSNNIIGNKISENLFGTYFSYSHNNSINGNNASSNDCWGILLISSNGNNITGNIILDTIEGIILSSCSANNVINNSISNTQDGICIIGSNYNMIAQNTVSNNYHGIFLSSSGKNEIYGNNATMNNDGIFLAESSKNNLTRNMAWDNDIGITVYFSFDNILVNNTLFSNIFLGLYIASSLYNIIYHNNFIANSVRDEKQYNTWNAPYPTGGNYWSDYTGVDEFSGPNQNQSAPDGIGDTPQYVYRGSWDNYPLMNPTMNDCIYLRPGWNLISIPFIKSDTNLNKVLNSIRGSYDVVQWYKNSNNLDPWKHHRMEKPSHLNDLTSIDHTMGFWIHITDSDGVLFYYPGAKPTQNQTITLHKGWNMVGYPSLTSYNRTEGLNNLTFSQEVDAILSYNTASQKWNEMGESDYFKLGKGYYIHAKNECVWEVLH